MLMFEGLKIFRFLPVHPSTINFCAKKKLILMQIFKFTDSD